MKNYSTIIVIFLFIVVGIVGVVVASKFMESDQLKKAEAQYQNYVQKYVQQSQNQNNTPTSTPTVSAASLSSDLGSLSDDGGKSDFDQLQTDLNGL